MKLRGLRGQQTKKEFPARRRREDIGKVVWKSKLSRCCLIVAKGKMIK